MTYDNWLIQPHDADWNADNRRELAREACFSSDEWHPSIEQAYEDYFNANYSPTSTDLPATFDAWLEKQSGEEIALIVSDWHFNQ